MIVKSHQLISEENFKNFSNIVSDKIHHGFKVVEKNDKLPFAVLLKEEKKVDHKLNFLIFCATLGIWSVVWIYITQVSSKAKQILVAIDEDGNAFEENCYMG